MPEDSLPSSSLGSLVCLPYNIFGHLLLHLSLKMCDVYRAICKQSALSPIAVIVIVLLHTMHNAFQKSPFTCNCHLGLNVNFLSIFFKQVATDNATATF